MALFIDSHVHFHVCFTWDVFLEAAARNFAQVRRTLHVGSESAGCLMFTESAGANAFRSLVVQGRSKPARAWRAEATDEAESVLLRHANGDTIIVVAGRQVVTAEKLEVLSLCTAAEFPDGQPIRSLLNSVARDGAVAVIPWGFGKWWGRRGRVIRALLELHRDIPFCLGDNGGRARRLPRPSLFDVAADHGIPVLGGSDPLPLPRHVTRAGSYGFVLEDWCETSRPASVIKERLRALTHSPTAFGRLSSAPEMMRSQLGLRWHRRRSALAAAV
jgi:hypothetical protein